MIFSPNQIFRTFRQHSTSEQIDCKYDSKESEDSVEDGNEDISLKILDAKKIVQQSKNDDHENKALLETVCHQQRKCIFEKNIQKFQTDSNINKAPLGTVPAQRNPDFIERNKMLCKAIALIQNGDSKQNSSPNRSLWANASANFVTWEGPTLAKFFTLYPEVPHLITLVHQVLWLQMSYLGKSVEHDRLKKVETGLLEMLDAFAQIKPLQTELERLQQEGLMDSTEFEKVQQELQKAEAQLQSKQSVLIESMCADGMLERAILGVGRDVIAPLWNLPVALTTLINKLMIRKTTANIAGKVVAGKGFLSGVAPQALAITSGGVGLFGNLVHIFQSGLGLRNLWRRSAAVSRQKMNNKLAALKASTPLMKSIINRYERNRKAERAQISAGKFLEWARALQWNGPAAAANIAIIVGAATGVAAVATFATPVVLGALAGFLLIGAAQIAWRAAKQKVLNKDTREDSGRNDAKEIVGILQARNNPERNNYVDFLKALGVPDSTITYISTNTQESEDARAEFLAKQLYSHSALDPSVDQALEWAIRAARANRILRWGHQAEQLMGLKYLAQRLSALKDHDGKAAYTQQQISDFLSKIRTSAGARKIRDELKNTGSKDSSAPSIKPGQHWTHALGAGTKAGDLSWAKKYNKKDFAKYWNADSENKTGFREFIVKSSDSSITSQVASNVAYSEYLVERKVSVLSRKLLSSTSHAAKIRSDAQSSNSQTIAARAARLALTTLSLDIYATQDAVAAQLAVHQVKERITLLAHQKRPLDGRLMKEIATLAKQSVSAKKALCTLVETAFKDTPHMDLNAVTRQFIDALRDDDQAKAMECITLSTGIRKLARQTPEKIIASFETYPRKFGIADKDAQDSAAHILRDRWNAGNGMQNQSKLDALIAFAKFAGAQKAIIGRPTLGNALRLRTWDLSADGKVLEQCVNAMIKGQPFPSGKRFSPHLVAAALQDNTAKTFMTDWLQTNHLPEPQNGSLELQRRGMKQIYRFERDSREIAKALGSVNQASKALATRYLEAKLPGKLKECANVTCEDLIQKWEGLAKDKTNENRMAREIDLVLHNRLTESLVLNMNSAVTEWRADEWRADYSEDVEEQIESLLGKQKMSAADIVNPLSPVLRGSVEARSKNLVQLLEKPVGQSIDEIKTALKPSSLELSNRLDFYVAALKNSKHRDAHRLVIEKEVAWMMEGKPLEDMPLEWRLEWSPDFLKSNMTGAHQTQVDKILKSLQKSLQVSAAEPANNLSDQERSKLILQMKCMRELEMQKTRSNKLKMLPGWVQKHLRDDNTRHVVDKVIRNYAQVPDQLLQAWQPDKMQTLLKGEIDSIDRLNGVSKKNFNAKLMACITEIQNNRQAAFFQGSV